MSKTSRRSLLSAASVAAVSLCIPATANAMSLASALPPPLPQAPVSDARLFELWEARQAAIAARVAAEAAFDEATARLPEWARSGPQYLASDGSFSGNIEPWPRMRAARPQKGLFRNVRPSLAGIDREYQMTLARFEGRRGYETEVEQVKRHHARARAQFAARCRRQKAAREKLNLPDLEASLDNAWDRIFAVEEQIREVAAPTAHGLAALILVEIRASCEGTNGGAMACGRPVLRAVQPHLSGAIGYDVAELLAADAASHASADDGGANVPAVA